MVIVVYGDGFRTRERVREMHAAFQAKYDPSGFNFSSFPAEGQSKTTPAEVFQAAMASPFLAERRMVVVRDAWTGLKKDAEKPWVEGLARVSSSTVLVFWETSAPAAVEKSGVFKKIKEMADAHVYAYPPLEGAALAQWTAQRAKAHGAAMEAAAAQELAARCGGDLWQMDAEIGKLAAYVSGGAISAAAVRELVRPAFEGQMFALMDTISRRDTYAALRLLEEERQAGSADFYLFTMLQRQIRLLLSARTLLDAQPRASGAEAAAALGAHAFVAGKVLGQARGFASPTLRAAHDMAYAFDVGAKSGRIDAGLAVDLLVARLMAA